MKIGERQDGHDSAARGRVARAAFMLLVLLGLSCPRPGLPSDVPPRAPWAQAEGGPPHGRGEGWRERRERRDALHEERMRRQREGWERRERMTPEERRSLRRDLHEANRDLYRP